MLLAKWLFPAATLCWLVVSIYQTLVMVIPQHRANWPLTGLLPTEGARRAVLGLMALSALGWGGTVLAESFGYTAPPIPLLLSGAGVLLAATGVAAAVYCAVLYRSPSAAKPDRF